MTYKAYLNLQGNVTRPSEHRFNFTKFKQYLEGIAGGNRSPTTATAIVRDIQRFFETVTPTGSTFTSAILLNLKVIEKYYHHLKTAHKFKPTTSAEKLRRLKMAIKYIIHANQTDQQMYIRGCQIVDTLSQWIHSLSKQISLQRQQHGVRVVNDLPTTTDPLKFTQNEEVHMRIKNTIKSLNDSYEDTEYKRIKLLIAFAAALIIYENCQRSGVVTNLTIEEYENRQRADNDMTVISCLNHKTGPQGRAQLVVSKSTEDLLQNYYTFVRSRVIPAEGCESLFFLTPQGKQYKQVYRKIREAAIANGFTTTLPPPPSKYRIFVSTEAARVLNDRDLRKVARHLSHSEQTSRQYYEFSNTRDATNAHKTIKLLSRERKRRHLSSSSSDSD